MKGIYALLFAMLLVLAPIDASGSQLTGDLYPDNTVDLLDLVNFADYWLDSQCSQPACAADLDGRPGVDMADFSFMADNWSRNYIPAVISEFMASNDSALYDEDGDSSDWIEIYNPTDEPVSMDGCFLTDDRTDPMQWQVPDGVQIDGGDFLLIYASGKNKRTPGAPLHTNFRLNRRGEYLALIAPNGKDIVSEYAPQFPEQLPDISYGLSGTVISRVLIEPGAPKRVLVPTGDIGSDWTGGNEPYADGNWDHGLPEIPGTSGGVGYERGSGYQNHITYDVETLMYGINRTCYIRIPFSVSPDDLSGYDTLTLKMMYDDAFVAYLNGQVVALSPRVPAALPWNAGASTYRPSDTTGFEDFDITGHRHLLQPDNILAIHGLNGDYTTSSDFLMSVELIASGSSAISLDEMRYFDPPTPGRGNTEGFEKSAERVAFSQSGGLFAEDFTLTLSTGLAGGQIRYTLNGAVPTLSSTQYTDPVPINTTSRIRARVYTADLLPGPVDSQSYVKMAADVVNFNSDLPLVVIDTNGASMTTGLYRPVWSVFVDKDSDGRARLAASADFAGRGGMKKRGSSTAGVAKPSYSFEVWDDDDEDRDVSLLGLPSDSDWVLYSPYHYDRALINNALAYNISNQVGRYAPRTKFVELFLNRDGNDLSYGDYFGLYILMEKIKRGPDRVDVERLTGADTGPPNVTGGYMIKIDRRDPGDGGFTTPNINNLCYVYPKESYILGDQSAYIRDYANEFETVLNGADFRDPVSGYAAYIDVDSWLEHDLINMLMMNVDALRLSTYMFKPRGGKFEMGPVWDFDRAMGSTDGRDYNPEAWHGTGDGTDYFSWGWWNRLFQDEDFYLRFMDGWFHLRETTFGIANLFATIDAQADEISEAQARHYARWDKPPRFDGFQGEIDHMKSWFASRVDWIDSQWPKPPIYNQDGGSAPADFPVAISKPAGAAGTIYYTLDGSDPRTPVTGQVAGTTYQGQFNITKSVVIKARIKNGSQWSPMNQAAFSVGPVAESLRITEMMYHPADPPEGSPYLDEDFEFVELKNTGDASVNLNLVRFNNGIDFTFADTPLGEDGYVVIVSNEAAFLSRYDDFAGTIAGEYTGRLENDGERITLVDATGQEIHNFRYNDRWYDITDGGGFSLAIKDPAGGDPLAWDSKSGWRPSAEINGSPGEDDPDIIPELGSIVINEVLAHSHALAPDWIELHNTTADQVINLGGWFLSDSANDLKKYEIPEGTAIDAGGYVVFYQNLHFGNPNAEGCHTPFAMSENGETIYLTSGKDGVLTGYTEDEDFDASETNVSFGRYQKSTGTFNFVAMSSQTPNAANAYPAVGPIVISEIMYHPAGDDNAEYIEMLNIGGSDEILFDATVGKAWKFADVGAGGIEFEIYDTELDLPVTIAPNERILLVRNKAAFAAEFPTAPPGTQIYAWPTGGLSNGGEKIQLSRPGDLDAFGDPYWIRMDRVVYSDGSHPENGEPDPWPTSADAGGKTLARKAAADYGNDIINWQAAEATPGW